MNVDNILKTASFIDTLKKGSYLGYSEYAKDNEFAFHMGVPYDTNKHGTLVQGCIVGSIHKINNVHISDTAKWADTKQYAAEYLGINDKQAGVLFCGGNPFRWFKTSPQDAAAVLRHLAYTGEVNWGIVDKPSILSRLIGLFKTRTVVAQPTYNANIQCNLSIRRYNMDMEDRNEVLKDVSDEAIEKLESYGLDPAEAVTSFREAVKAIKEGRTRPWSEVKEELGV